MPFSGNVARSANDCKWAGADGLLRKKFAVLADQLAGTNPARKLGNRCEARCSDPRVAIELVGHRVPLRRRCFVAITYIGQRTGFVVGTKRDRAGAAFGCGL